MKISKQLLLSILQPAFSVISDSNPMVPILSSGLLCFSPDGATCTGSNGRAYLTVKIEGKFEYMDFCIERSFLKFVSALPEQELDLKLSGQTLHLDHASGKCKFETLPANEYNTVPTLPEDRFLTINSGELKDACHLVMPFKQKEDDLPVFDQTLLVSNMDGIGTCVVGYDKRLNSMGAATFNADLRGNKIILTTGMATAIASLPYDEPVHFSSTDRFLHMECGNLVASEVLSTVKWPDSTSQILSGEGTLKLTVSGDMVKNAIKRLLLTAASPAEALEGMEFSAFSDMLTIKFKDSYESVPCSGDIHPFFMPPSSVIRCCNGSVEMSTSLEVTTPVYFKTDGLKAMSMKCAVINPQKI